MRRRSALARLALVAAVAATAVTAASVPMASARDDRTGLAGPGQTTPLLRATEALYGDGSAARRPEATLALRDLFLARDRLGELGDRFAGGLLARPTDGPRDPFADGYDAPSARRCSDRACVHWVRRTVDRPSSNAWVGTTLRVMDRVWSHHVARLGYRAPARDGRRGGDGRFDVYLKELGGQGVYGYCAPERRVAGAPRQASGFCVLDNDFARAQFGRRPVQSLRVTAAHEFFHALQFAYDFGEDPWLLESTATWMEERFADGVDDNRAYLRFGQLGRPDVPLDLFEPSGYAHYGNWTFWEYLSDRFGRDVVRAVWRRAGTGGGLPDDYSTRALRRVLADAGGLPRLFAAYSAGNTVPGRTYPEGAVYPRASTTLRRLSAARPRTELTTRIDHLTSRSVLLRPQRSLRGGGWRLTIKVKAPDAVRSPAAHLIVSRADRSRQRRPIRLNRTGYGVVTLPVGRRTPRTVTVTLANASTRYRCDRGTTLACQGRPRDDAQPFTLKAFVAR